MNNEKALEILKQNLPQIRAIIGLHSKPGVDTEALALQELENLRLMAVTKPDIAKCTPESILLAVKNVLKQNLTLDPYAGLVYIKTRNVKVAENNWQVALEIQPSANGLLSIARQCGRVLDMKRPEVKKDPATGMVTEVSVEMLLPSTPEPRWETFKFDTDDFTRWRRASDKENGRGKEGVGGEDYKYANANYTNWKGGLDPEFARAKAMRHALKKLGTNLNEVFSAPANFKHAKLVDPRVDEVAATEDAPHVEISSQTIKQTVEIPNTKDL